MATAERTQEGLKTPLLSDEEAALTKASTRCLMAALDHSRAKAIRVVDDEGTESPVLHLPPKVLRIVARVLSVMGDQRVVTLVPNKHELSTTDAANLLNVSRPFLIKQLDAEAIPYRKVGTHRRIAYQDLLAYRKQMHAEQDRALDELVADAQELGLE
ncbi:MAG TPA: helix-turn-helix domain-containing protein [Caldimonas sp.]|nr:helix-turn-helix domain-containing protein [Caldimonas sp.]HEX2542475.1 helix-turn-helix domain-containing protein [Caldimonas sp.]